MPIAAVVAGVALLTVMIGVVYSFIGRSKHSRHSTQSTPPTHSTVPTLSVPTKRSTPPTHSIVSTLSAPKQKTKQQTKQKTKQKTKQQTKDAIRRLESLTQSIRKQDPDLSSKGALLQAITRTSHTNATLMLTKKKNVGTSYSKLVQTLLEARAKTQKHNKHNNTLNVPD